MAITRKLRFQSYHADATTFVGEVGDMFFDADSQTLRIGDGTTPGGNPVTGGGGSLPLITISYADQAESGNNSVGNIGDSGIGVFDGGAADVLYNVSSASTVTATGAVYYWPSGVGTTAGTATDGDNGVRFVTGFDQEQFVVMVYATNAAGTAYSAPASGTSFQLCLAAGTSIALSDGTYKPIEAITYDDLLLVWDFDRGCYAESKPLWIKSKTVASKANYLRFSDDSVLYTINQHRIFNGQAGKFTHPMTDDTPLGTITYNQYGREVTLVEKQIIEGDFGTYNVITDYHMNLFANGILTSCSFNNLYPIANMQFVKDSRPAMRYDVPKRFHDGMRLAEQLRDTTEVKAYIARMMAKECRSISQPG